MSVVPELELSGRALEFAREDWHAAVSALAQTWVEALTADLVEDRPAAERAVAEPIAEARPIAEAEPVVEPEPIAEPGPVAESEPIAETEPSAGTDPVSEVPEPSQPLVVKPSDKSRESAREAVAEIAADSHSEDPLAPVWQGRYEKNRRLPLIAALALFLLIKRRRRQRADKAGADSSFRME
ncbi:hypothetical protein ACFQ9X_01415 [Catenulispora yoronensis]